MNNPIIVSSGQIVSGITIVYGDPAFVENGGMLEASTIDAGGVLTVSAGGVASGIYANSGSIQNAGTVIGTVLTGYYDSLDQTDLAGSVASGTLILGGATEEISASALSLDTTVSSGGYQDVLGGTASGTFVFAGGTQYLLAGTAAGTDVLSDGFQSVEYGGNASGGRVENGGFMFLASGSVQATSVESGGEVLVANTGSAAQFAGVIASGGMLVTDLETGQSHAKLVGTEVQSGGTLVLLDGDTETGAVIDSGAIVISATAAVFTTISRLTQFERLDSAAAGVLSGGTVGFAQTEVVYSGGHASAATVVSGGHMDIDSGGNAAGTVIGSGGFQYENGVAQLTIILSGGADYVGGNGASGTSISAMISAGGQQQIEAGGVASGALVLAGGVQIAGSYVGGGQPTNYGTAIDTRVASGGVLGIITGSSVNAVIASGGDEGAGGGTIDGTTVQSGGQLHLSPANYTVVSGGTIQAGGLLVLNGYRSYASQQTFTGTVLASGATELLLGDASETGLVIEPGAKIEHASVAVFSGANSETEDARLTQAGNTLSGVNVGLYSEEEVLGGGTAIATAVSSVQFVYSGGAALDTRLMGSGVVQYVYSGATATSTAVLSGASQNNGGSVSDTIVYGGGVQDDSGVASGTVVFGGGTQEDFGVASGTVLSGGTQTVKGVAYNTVVAAGGNLNEVRHGMIYDTTVLAGGTAQVTGLGATGITISGGGRVFLALAAVASDTTISAGGILHIGIGSAVDTIVQLGGTIDLSNLSFVSGGTAVLNSNDLLTITEGSASYHLQLAGTYAGETFHLQQDASSGTLITLSAAQQAITTVGQSAELLPQPSAPQQFSSGVSVPSLTGTERTPVHEQVFAAIEHFWQQ